MSHWAEILWGEIILWAKRSKAAVSNIRPGAQNRPGRDSLDGFGTCEAGHRFLTFFVLQLSLPIKSSPTANHTSITHNSLNSLNVWFSHFCDLTKTFCFTITANSENELTFISYNLGDLRVNLRIMQKDFVFIYYSSMYNVITLAVGKRRKTNASNFKRHFLTIHFVFNNLLYKSLSCLKYCKASVASCALHYSDTKQH